MDTVKFDAITRLFSNGLSRREALRGLLAGSAAVAVGAVALEDAAAKKRRRRRKNKKKKKNKNQQQCKPAGAFCDANKECCPDKTKRICDVAFNASNSDKTCCGGTGAKCGPPNEDGDLTAPFCCAGYDCHFNTGSSTGVCQLIPEDF